MSKRDEKVQAMVDHVIELIEEHGVNWSNGWKDISTRPMNVDTGTVYRGWNSLWLGMLGATHVATFKGWQRLGYSCKGLKGKGIAVTTRAPVKKKNEHGVEEVAFIKWGSVTVFRAQDVKHFETGEPWLPPIVENLVDKTEVLSRAEQFLTDTGIEVRHAPAGGAFYSPSGDYIQLPNRELFEGTDTSSPTECLYSTWAHEAIHATGHKSRLNRLTEYHTKEGRAKEELVAEFGAILLSIDLGIEITPREDHAAYIEGWLKALKGDSPEKFLMSAAADAQKAIEHLESMAGCSSEAA